MMLKAGLDDEIKNLRQYNPATFSANLHISCFGMAGTARPFLSDTLDLLMKFFVSCGRLAKTHLSLGHTEHDQGPIFSCRASQICPWEMFPSQWPIPEPC